VSTAPASFDEIDVVIEDDIDQAIAKDLACGAFAVPKIPIVAVCAGEAVSAMRSAPEIARLVSMEPALAADVLRLANTAPFSNNGNRVDTLEKACARLGERQIVRLCLASTLGGIALTSGPLVALRRRYWNASLASALVCEALAKSRAIRPDGAYIAGLLHDFGKVLALAFIEQRLDMSINVISNDALMSLVERHHVDVGWHLAETWQLPKPIPELIAAHHQDMRPGTVPLLDILRTSDDVIALMATTPTLTVEDIAAIDGIVSSEEAASVLRALVPLSQMLRALSDVPAPAPPPPSPQHSNASSSPMAFNAGQSCSIPTNTLGAKNVRGLVTTAVSRASLTITSSTPLSAGWVAHIELQTMPKPMRLFVTVVACAKQNGVYTIEAKPMALSGPLKEEWFKFVDSKTRETLAA
jgi:putative nucleotidyltransferase with HDIG domain